MKSAKEWMIDIYGDYDEGTEDVIRRIQRDALEAAARVLEDDRNYSDAINYRPNTYQLADRIRATKPKDEG